MPPAALVVNPAATRVTAELVAAVEDALGPVETIVTERVGQGAEVAAEASRSCERVYVLAGDGGFNEVVNGLDDSVPVGFLPGGATNVLPRALGLPGNPLACARRLARSRRTRRISLGRVEFAPAVPPPDRPEGAPTPSPDRRPEDRRRFTFSAALGLPAEVVRAVDRMGRTRAGRRPPDVVYLWKLVRLLVARHRRREAPVRVVGHAPVALALVANCDPYTYFGPLAVHAAPEARFELGVDLVAPTRVTAGDLPALAFALLTSGRHVRRDDVLYVHDADELRVDCERPTALQVDGEDLGDVTEAVFAAEREALEVIV